MRRLLSRPVLLSIALHGVVFSALLVIKPRPSSSDSPRVLSFRLVQFENGSAADSGRDRDAPVANADPDAASTRARPAETPPPMHAQSPAAASAQSEPAAAPQRTASSDTEPNPKPAAAARAAPPAPRPLQAKADSATQTERAPAGPRDQLARAGAARPLKKRPQHPERARPQPGPVVPRSRPAIVARTRAVIQNDSTSADASIGAPAPAALPPLPAPVAADAPSPPQPALAAAERSIEPPRLTRPVSESERRTLQRQVDDVAERVDEALLSQATPSRASAEPTIAFKHKGQQYVATFTALPAEDSMHVDRLVMSVSTEQNGHRLSTRLQLKRMAFSNFAQFVDHWDPRVQIHDDRIEGRFHSNSEIYVEKSHGVEPQFLGKVTTARSVDTSYSEGFVSRAKIFLGGLETSVRPILLPRRFRPFADGAVNPKRVQRFERDARLRFYADGSYGWSYVDSDAPEQHHRLPEAPYYLIAEDKAALYIEGTVNGKVLVYSPEKIVIEGDVIYADDASVDTDSDDYLGLVSDKNVEIAPPDVTGPGDLHVQASIYARRWFEVKDYTRSEHSTLSVYGSLTAGSLTATEPRYRTEMRFDRRFERSRPPGFPVSDHYEIASWNGRWTVDPDAPGSQGSMAADSGEPAASSDPRTADVR